MTTHERSATELATEMTNLLAGFQIRTPGAGLSLCACALRAWT